MGNIPLKEISWGAVIGGSIFAIKAFMYSMPVIGPTVAGGVIVGGLIGGVYGYLKTNGENFGHKKVYQTESETEPSTQDLTTQSSSSGYKIPDWKQIPLTQDQLQQLEDLKKLDYDYFLKSYKCPLTNQVMRQPIKVNCCKTLFQKIKYQEYFNKIQQCPNQKCNSKENNFEHQIPYQVAIGVFRGRVRKTYRGLPDLPEKQQWKKMIEQDFGKEYIEKFL